MDIPTGWQAQPVPSGGMRAAQFELPKAGSDPEAPTCIAFILPPGQGGGVEGNIVRWRGMFVETGDPALGRTEETASPNGEITLFEKSGTYKQSATPMSQDFTAKEGWRMIAAVVEVGGGSIFFRAAGPEASVSAQRDALINALKSIRKASGTEERIIVRRGSSP